jgi:Aerotolerance regulator N-terminal/von Willebrand factor type A domain
MSFGVLNIAMLAGLAAVSLPVIIHLLSRRRDPMIEWGAMQFLELGPRSRRRINLADQLLMLARMLLIGLVALAMARPFLAPKPAKATSGILGMGAGVRRDVVLVLDGSSSMGRRVGGSTPRERAIAWARNYIAGLGSGDSVAVLVAKDRVRPLIDPPSFDRAKVDAALASAPAPRGSSDLSAAVGEAFRILERPGNPARDVIVLSDGHRVAWRPGEPARWALLRDLRNRLPIPPRLWALDFGQPTGTGEEGADGSIVGLDLSRQALVPGLPVTVTATVANAGPGPLTRPIELLVDGEPARASGQVVGPIPRGGRASATFRVALDEPGSHLLTVRLAPADDPMPSDDEMSRPVEVAAAIPALLVDGDPGRGPLGGEVDFLRIALAPNGDDAPTVRATVIDARGFMPELLRGKRVVVLANVDRLPPGVVAALDEFVSNGGGLLIAPGDRTGTKFAGDAAWMPASLGETKGSSTKREAVAHPAPRTFHGPALAPLGQGEAPALAEADLFAYRVLEPREGSSVLARLDTGDAWVVERPHGKGRVIAIASALDAEAGTLPVNPDFVPLVHELILQLGAGTSAANIVRPGEPITFDLPGVAVAAGATLPLFTPEGATVRVPASRSGESTRVRYAETAEPGVYRLTKPNPPGGHAYAMVASDPREADPARLDPAEAVKLSEGWPLAFEPDPSALPNRIASGDASPRREVWRWLIFAALGGLCVEVWMTRRMAKARGLG